jgi:hypothetical protein
MVAAMSRSEVIAPLTGLSPQAFSPSRAEPRM